MLRAAGVAGPAAWAATPAAAQAPRKVLRYAFPVAESGFDPPRLLDLYSRVLTAHIFEALYQYDPLARPARVRPLTADGMPEASDDFRVWTVKVQPGIHFADDPVFKGRPRELTAADHVYTLKRYADPALKGANWTWIETFGFVGLAELRRQALEGRQPFDYERPIEGVRALDRYTIQYRVAAPRPRLLTEFMAGSDVVGAVAREVVEFYGDEITAHPVGTGPFRLAQWRRSSFIALERNPHYRPRHYDAEPAADDAAGQAILARFKGRRLPMIDRVEVSIIQENQPRWLTFLQRGSDYIEDVPAEFIDRALPGGAVAPNLARQGIAGHRMVRADIAFTYFNMEDPVLGGYTPEKVALRRAIALALDIPREIRLVRHGQAIVAQSPVMPHTYGYDPQFKSENGDYSLARAKALLDLYGYVDRNGDGWREMPDGSPLLLRRATQPDQLSRQLDEEWRRNMAALAIRIEFVTAQWPENLKAGRAGKLQMWSAGLISASPDGQGTFQRYDGRQIGGQNFARFRLPAMDAVYDRLSVLPDGPERLALFEQAKRLAVAYMPYKTHEHRYVSDLTQPWVIGYRRPLFWYDFWQYLDIDLDEQRRRGAAARGGARRWPCRRPWP
ncbi:MAG: bicyclomycin resistance protein, partial [Burkholderiales bacterium]|nr:bicyclomycin resistance protein [Burkholderiales bacterium]